MCQSLNEIRDEYTQGIAYTCAPRAPDSPLPGAQSVVI